MSRELDRMRKRANQHLNEAKSALNESFQSVDDHLSQIQQEYHRVTELSYNATSVIDDIDQQFRAATKLTKTDVVLLFLCTGLQCARQYLLSNDKYRVTAEQGDALMENTVGSISPPSVSEVLFQSVPYDAVRTGPHITETGIAGTTHRYRTLGHDPVLGWIFGTANIMTSSLTKMDFITTYQVSNMRIVRHYPLGTPGMLQKTIDYAQRDPMLLAAAVARQAIHFGSDYFTEQGLPIPFLGTLAPDVAHRFMFPYRLESNKRAYLDTRSIVRGAAVAVLINQLIALIHRLFYDPNKDGSEQLYEVRTRRILSYSNAIAVGSNVVVTAFTKDLKRLDVGGIIVALHRFISDEKFIESIKTDFLKNELHKKIVGQPYDFMEVE